MGPGFEVGVAASDTERVAVGVEKVPRDETEDAMVWLPIGKLDRATGTGDLSDGVELAGVDSASGSEWCPYCPTLPNMPGGGRAATWGTNAAATRERS